jgi:hypothetical protein
MKAASTIVDTMHCHNPKKINQTTFIIAAMIPENKVGRHIHVGDVVQIRPEVRE